MTSACELDPAATPAAIEARSFAIIESLLPPPRKYTGLCWRVARRCLHTAGDVTLLDDLVLSEEAVAAGLAALRVGSRIITDTVMAKVGLTRRFLLEREIEVSALMSLPGLADEARRRNCTRAAAAVHLLAHDLANDLADTIVVIGNAPTALLALLAELEAGVPPPRLIVGMPVGFVNAAQSKAMLAKTSYPHITLLGTRGGSALAAACVNALCEIAANFVEPPFGE